MEYRPFDATGLASRLRRLSQLMLSDGDRAYAAAGLDFRTRFFPIVYALDRDGPMSVNELAGVSGFTQPAISQTLRQLVNAGHVEVAAGRDARERIVSLTPAGRERIERLRPFWQRARRTMERLLEESAPDFMASLTALETALERQSLFERIGARQAEPGEVEILPFDVTYKDAFRTLNLEWVEAYFRVEPYDREQLEHPDRILETGGEIYFARLDGVMVGTGALYCHGDGEFEIAKMAVTGNIRGKGIGRRLVDKLIQRFRERGGRRLRLATNAQLEAAIRLYRSVGFVEYTPDSPSRYERANVFMEWHDRANRSGPGHR